MTRTLALVVGAFLAAPAFADEGFTFDFPKPAFEYALNPDTGGLAVIVPSQNQVVLYPRFVATKGKGEPLVAKVGKLPTDIAFKQVGDKAYFAVISHAERELALLDAVTLKPVKTFQLDVAWPMSVVVSTNPKDAAVYYAGYTREKWGMLGRIDLTTMKDDGRLIISGRLGSPAVSADGSRLYLWQGPDGQAQTIEAQEFIRPRPVQPNPKEPTLQDTRVLHRATTKIHTGQPPMLADPYGGFVVCDRRVLTPMLDAEITTLPFGGGLISATRPVIYGINVADGRLAAVSVNTHKLVCSHRLPLKPAQYDFGDRLPIDGPASLGYGTAIRYHPRLLEDPANKMLLVCIGSGVQAIPVAELALPDEPFLVARIEGSTDFTVGKKQDVSVSTVGRDSKVELASGPTGMTLEAGRLAWTPGETDVGVHVVKLKVFAKDTDRTVPVAITVTRPSIQLPFPPPPGGADYRLVTATDGKVAIVAGPDPDDKPGGPFRAPSVVAVVNLDKGTVAVQRKLLVGVTTLAADSSYVYAGLADSDSMYVLHRKDLTEAKRIPMPARVAYISPVDDRHVIVTCNSRDRIVLKVPEWEAVALADFDDPKAPPRTPSPTHRTVPPPVRFAEGWWTDGVLYDDKFEKARAVIAPWGYWRYAHGTANSYWMPPTSTAVPPDGTKFFEKTSPMWFTRWGMAITQQSKLTNGLRDVGPLEDFRTSLILSELPVAACLNTGWDANAPGGPRHRVEVIYHDLITSKVVLRVPVLDERRSRGAVPSHDPFTALFLRPGGGLIALVEHRLFLMPTPNIEAAKCPAPLHFSPQYPTTIITRTGSVPLPKLIGATASVEIALRREIKGVSIDRKNWAVTVDPAPLIETLTEGIGTVMGNLKAKPTAGQDGTAFEKYMTEVGPRFERLTGRKANGVPVWVPVAVIAQDVGTNPPMAGGGLRTAEADIGFFLELPMAPVRAKINAVAAAHPKNPDPNPMAKVDPPLTAAQLADILREQGKLQLRVETLEKKIDDLNRKIEALTKALEAKKP